MRQHPLIVERFVPNAVVVTNEKVLGKKIRTLGIHQKYGVVISRLNRAGIELVPTANTTLQFGDVLHMVGAYRCAKQSYFRNW